VGIIEEDRDELGKSKEGKRKSGTKEKGGDRKSSSSSSRSTKKKGASDREKKIAMHAKAKRVATTEMMATQMEGMSLGRRLLPPPQRGGGGEPTTPAISQRHLLSGNNNKRQERYDNIYATHQSMVGSFVAPVYEKTDDEVEFLLDALSDNFVFNTLDEVELETLVNAFEHVQYSTGTTIINQGEYGGYFYVLSYGIVAFVVNDVEVGRATCGNSFGELALLYNAPRAATCIVVGDDNDDNNNNSNATTNNNNANGAGLWRVDQVTFRKLLAAHTIQNDNQTKVVLRKVPFLSDLDDEFIHRIADALTTVYYDAGDTIFARGSEGSVFYVIREGKVQYEHYKRGIKTLRPGDYFGEQAIVKNEARRATATAMKDTIALALSRDIFERVLGPLSDVIQRSNDRRLLGNVPLFANSDIQSFEIELMGALIDDVKYPSEKEILSEGDYVDVPALYLVRSGVLEAYTDAGESRILKAGMYFGEDTLLPDKDFKYGGKGGLKQSVETVEVLEDCVLGKLTLANIDSVILDLSRMGGGKRGRDTLQRSIDIVKLVRHTLLGAGTFGQVWLTSDKKTGNAYALKVQIKRELIDHKQAEGVCRELDVMRKIDHPFIIKLVNTSQDEQSVFMLLNLVQGGELFNIMHNDDRDCIPESEVQFYAAGILEALSYMHRRRIIYRDLKPENVLIDDLGYTVIVDLGFAKVVSDKTYTLCGTPLCK
jgi:CRP-like cAMP-binding protein